MNIGAHVSTKGGLACAPARAREIGAECFQTHPTSPQSWRPIAGDDSSTEAFSQAHRDAGSLPHYFHAIYLINLATPKDGHREQSGKALVDHLQWGERLGASGVVFHPGSHLGAGFEVMLPAVISVLTQVIEETEECQVPLLLENNAGSGACIGRSFEEIAAILDGVNSPRLRMCLDTAHVFASGYDIRSPEGAHAMLNGLNSTIGMERISLVHANDSKSDLGSNADRHENIGDGKIGSEGLSALFQDPRMACIDAVLEVPGMEHEGPDRTNINRLRACAGKAELG